MTIVKSRAFEELDKVVSVSLFGTKSKYLRGAEKLVESVGRHLPGWRIVFFVGNSVPEDIRKKIQSQGARIVPVREPEGLAAAAWRFRVDELGNPDCVLFRDSDSLVSRREASAVNQWVASGSIAHIIRDHPFHSAPILAGLWGLRPSLAKWFGEELKTYRFLDVYGSDQSFLAEKVYPKLAKSSVIHASYHRHESSIAISEFEIGHSRLGPFCGEGVTSPILERLYARFRRLIDPKDCKCRT
jgi:hypothetical protein